MPTRISRRSLLASLLAQAGQPMPFADYSDDFRIEAQTEEPRVRCYDLRHLRSWITPEAEFFAFHQGRTIKVDAQRWRLAISGFVNRPREWRLEALHVRPDVRSLTTVIECSGNSGNPALMNGLVSNATWTGVPLAALLEECRIAREAREVVFFGADSTTERKWSAAGREFTTPHGRSLHVQDARESNALLAFSMNGRPLPAEQGFPLRLVLPGWYGMAQIKWLTRIEVIDRRYEGQHMSRNYHSLHRRSDNTVLDTSITRNRLKSVVARLTGSAGEYSVSGAAWGGERPISAVEVRVDSGPWKRATLSATSEPNAWLLWSVDVGRLVPGKHEIVSRAIDDRGTIQPTREEWKRRFASNREDHSQWVRRVVISA